MQEMTLRGSHLCCNFNIQAASYCVSSCCVQFFLKQYAVTTVSPMSTLVILHEQPYPAEHNRLRTYYISPMRWCIMYTLESASTDNEASARRFKLLYNA